MALVQVKEVFRSGLAKQVTRFVSPPNPSSPTSFLWKADSFSMQRRALLLSRMTEFKTSLFSATQVATPPAEKAVDFHMSAAREAGQSAEELEDAKGVVTSAGTSSSEVDEGLLDRSYGQEQADHHKVSEITHDHHMSTKDGEEPENLENTGFDMSKMSRPTGGE